MATYTLTVTSELDKLAVIARFVGEAASAMGMDADGIYALQLAVDEACTNVIDYAYEGRSGQPVTVECHEDHGLCIVVIRDRGKPFDPSAVPLPDLTSPISRRQVGGLGIYLMRRLTDEVRFSFSDVAGNELTLVKAIKPRDHAQTVSSERSSDGGATWPKRSSWQEDQASD